MPTGTRRERTLYGLNAVRGRVHRYTWWRWGIAIISTAAVAALPLTHTLRIDLWAGNNYWLGERVGYVEAAKAFAFPFLTVNVLIAIGSRFLGRWLCGFGCPIGNLARLSEWGRWFGLKRKTKWLGPLLVLGACTLLAAITFSFWVDWRVFGEGSPLAIGVAALFFVGLTGGTFGIVHGRGWGSAATTVLRGCTSPYWGRPPRPVSSSRTRRHAPTARLARPSVRSTSSRASCVPEACGAAAVCTPRV